VVPQIVHVENLDVMSAMREIRSESAATTAEVGDFQTVLFPRVCIGECTERVEVFPLLGSVDTHSGSLVPDVTGDGRALQVEHLAQVVQYRAVFLDERTVIQCYRSRASGKPVLVLEYSVRMLDDRCGAHRAHADGSCQAARASR
jgi:hypothetical protein